MLAAAAADLFNLTQVFNLTDLLNLTDLFNPIRLTSLINLISSTIKLINLTVSRNDVSDAINLIDLSNTISLTVNRNDPSDIISLISLIDPTDPYNLFN